ncbi:hypothetical protein J1605_013859 [Eschrichtius robustus]|uniref:Uncharacterized protein n=1 Tax=Eschrichtius robustus TaxID=9764 RepID=A0AB34GE10_ESCRO|nr:hypothetical protein J1605_013859 [Eschrichtius robustus]
MPASSVSSGNPLWFYLVSMNRRERKAGESSQGLASAPPAGAAPGPPAGSKPACHALPSAPACTEASRSGPPGCGCPEAAWGLQTPAQRSSGHPPLSPHLTTRESQQLQCYFCLFQRSDIPENFVRLSMILCGGASMKKENTSWSRWMEPGEGRGTASDSEKFPVWQMQSGLIICGGGDPSCWLDTAKTPSISSTHVLLPYQDVAPVLAPETVPVREGAWCLMSTTWGRGKQGPSVLSALCYVGFSKFRQGPASSL